MRSPDDDEALLQAIIGCYGGLARKAFDSESLLDLDEHTITMEADDGCVPSNNPDVEQLFTPPRKLFNRSSTKCSRSRREASTSLFGDSGEPRAAARLRTHSEGDPRRRLDVSSSQGKKLTLQGPRLPGRPSSFFEANSPRAEASQTQRLREKREPFQTAIASQRQSFFEEDTDDEVGLAASQGSRLPAPPMTLSVPFVKSYDVVTCAFNFESMTSEGLQALVADIPLDVRGGIAHDLGTQDPPVIHDSPACSKAVSIFIKETVELHGLRAESFRSERHRWQVDEEWFEFGFLRKVATVAGMLTNEEEVKSMLAAVDAEDSKVQASHHDALCAAQRQVLRGMVPSYADAVALYLGVAAFAEKQQHGPEPNLQRIRQFMQLIENEAARRAIGLTSMTKYNSFKIKPKEWRDDVVRVLTFGFLAFTAFHE